MDRSGAILPDMDNAKTATQEESDMTAVAEQGKSADQAITEQLTALEGKRARVKVVGENAPFDGKVKRASDKDGESRFQIGRRIVSVSTITNVLDPEADAPPPVASGGSDAASEPEAATDATPKAGAEDGAPLTQLTTGKLAVGKTTTIRCAWVDPNKRTKKQQELFDSGFAGVEKGKAYEAVVKAAGKGKSAEDAMPDGRERVIKVQDAFQVRFCPENQQKRRNELRARKARERKAAREAAKA